MTIRRVTGAELAWAKRLLTQEGFSGTSESSGEAAARIFEQIHLQLDPLIGDSGVQALLARSGKLAHPDYAFLAAQSADAGRRLRAHASSQTPEAALESAATLVAIFFSLIITFIGERLTREALREAWPTLEPLASPGASHE